MRYIVFLGVLFVVSKVYSLENATCEDLSSACPALTDECASTTLPTFSPSMPPTTAAIQSDSLDDIDTSSVSFPHFSHFSMLSVDPISDGHLLRTRVETPYFGIGNRAILNVVSLSNGCLDVTEFAVNFDNWPLCSNIPKPIGNWSSFIQSAFSQSSPSTFNPLQLLNDSWIRYPLPPQTVHGFHVNTTATIGHARIVYNIDMSVASLSRSCNIFPDKLGPNDNYATLLTLNTFYLDDSDNLISSCEKEAIEINVNHDTNAVASVSTDFSIAASVQKIAYESCYLEDCVETLGPQNKCRMDNDVSLLAEDSLFRRLVLTLDISSIDTEHVITNINSGSHNCYGFGSDFTVDPANNRLLVKTACINMIYTSNTDSFVDCDAFHSCSNPLLSDRNYDFVMTLAKNTTVQTPHNVDMKIDIEWTECPAYSKITRSINMESELEFYKGQSDNSALANPYRSYSAAEEVVLTLSLTHGSVTGAHNLRIRTVSVCLLDTTVPNFAAKLDCIVSGNCAALGTAFANHAKGCQKYTWPQTTANPFKTQYSLLHDFSISQYVFESTRCKSSTPSNSNRSCATETCDWAIAGHNDQNTWDAFRIASTPFMRGDMNVSWIIDVVGDVEFCDNSGRRRLQSIAALPSPRIQLPSFEHPASIRLRASAPNQDASCEKSTKLTFTPLQKTSKEHVFEHERIGQYTNFKKELATLATSIGWIGVGCIVILLAISFRKNKSFGYTDATYILPKPARFMKVSYKKV